MDPEIEQQPAGIGFKIIVIVLGLAIAGIAFSAIDRSGESTTTPSQGDRAATLLAQGIDLFEGADNAFRIGFEPAGGANLILRFTPDTTRVTMCPLTGFEAALPPPASCRQDIFSGVRQELTTPGLRAIAFVVREGSARADLSIEYTAASGEMRARLPLLPAPRGASVCEDNGCNPFFEVRPARSGSFSAAARWTGGAATLELLQGSVLGRSATATGVPYRVPAAADGSSPLRISASLSAPAEYALAIRHVAGPSAAPLSDIQIEATWPR